MDESQIEVPAHEIDREIYVMPAFVTLPVSVLAVSRPWYAALGFVELAVMPPGVPEPQLVHLRRYRYQDLLLVPAGGDAGIAGAVRMSFAHTGAVDELDEAADRLSVLGTGRVEGPHTTPWHAIELVAHDPDGHIVVLTARSDEPPPQQWVNQVQAAVSPPDGPELRRG